MADKAIEWLIDAGQEPLFDIHDAICIADLPRPTLQNWVSREFFKPTQAGEGYGSRRLYSANDLIVLNVAYRLTTTFAMSPQEAISIAWSIWIEVLRQVKRDKVYSALTSSIVLVRRDGKKWSARVLDGASGFDALANGNPGIILAAGVAIRKVAQLAFEDCAPAKYSPEPA